MAQTLDSRAIGQPLRVIGFGTTVSGADDGGTKRTGLATLAEVAASTIDLAASPSQPCDGDSGGPALLTANGAEVAVGVVSAGDPACTGFARATRVDVYLGTFIVPFLIEDSTGVAVGDRCVVDGNCATSRCQMVVDGFSTHHRRRLLARDPRPRRHRPATRAPAIAPSPSPHPHAYRSLTTSRRRPHRSDGGGVGLRAQRSTIISLRILVAVNTAQLNVLETYRCRHRLVSGARRSAMASRAYSWMIRGNSHVLLPRRTIDDIATAPKGAPLQRAVPEHGAEQGAPKVPSFHCHF